MHGLVSSSWNGAAIIPSSYSISGLTYKEKKKEKNRKKNRGGSELNEKTYGQAHYRELGKNSSPYKLRVEIAAHCSQWGEVGNTKGQLVPPAFRGNELTLEGAWLTVF